MRNAMHPIGACALVLLADCGRNDIDTRASSQAPRHGQQQFGSAMDISTNSQLPANPHNGADNGIGGPVQRDTGSTGTTGAIAANQLSPIHVQVRDRNVTLTGPVRSDDEKATIAKQVEGMGGVRSVQNNLTVGGETREHTPPQALVPKR